ncbi:HIT family protein [Sedimentisphaera salicampi]|uniref:HIT-like protein n=1 Tax=Sedimentisphaera salicampi TaxID=1941349 RepID=A0A1W6LPJ5_9BACT|nr:HIT family protein [Sedimentisphaera salicampi]ARN57676.1 HIT-like protein [Sedimentisphaera salicampi]OXU14241.1 HIT-like protein [Sedimentisphaera salicampi]
MDCVFCKIIAGQIPCSKVYEDDNVLAFMDINPLAEYHTLVIPKEHFEFLWDCPAELSAAIGSALPKISRAVQKASGSDGCNVLNNNASAAGQAVPHIHFHIIPRFENDGVFTEWPAKQLAPEKAQQAAEKIKTLIDAE